jgi:hypothetical protein
MNKKLTVLIGTIMLLILISPKQVDAHNLVWGVESDSVFEYSATGLGNGRAVDVDYSVTIDSFEAIPEVPTWPHSGGTWPWVSITLRYLGNGSTFSQNSFSWLYGQVLAAVPIGHWSYLSTVADNSVSWNIETVSFQNTTHWGHTDTWTATDDVINRTAVYLKENGVLQTFSGYHYDDYLGEVHENIEIEIINPVTSTSETSSTTEPTTGPSLDSPMLLIIVGALGVSLVIIIVVMYNKR